MQGVCCSEEIFECLSIPIGGKYLPEEQVVLFAQEIVSPWVLEVREDRVDVLEVLFQDHSIQRVYPDIINIFRAIFTEFADSYTQELEISLYLFVTPFITLELGFYGVHDDEENIAAGQE